MVPTQPIVRAEAQSEARIIAIWLLVGCALLAGMVVLGGVTRLTGSGLSMVDWEPVSGAVPPLDAEAWEREFSAYRASPQYRLVNSAMSLSEFKRIFWFEYAHRLLGRVIGLVFVAPFAVFLYRRMIPRELVPRLLLILALGGAQGVLGWWMVQSGLVDVPRVSPYRLTAHLALAVLVYGVTLWTAMGLLRPAASPGPSRSELGRWSAVVLGLVSVTMLSGGFVAGLHAGLVYNTFPKMGASWVPPDLFTASPWWLNLFENVTTVQFDHRLLAVLTLAGVTGLCWSSARRARGAARRWALAACVAAWAQVALGVSTLLLFVPVPLAALHQANALVLFTTLLGLTFELRRHARLSLPGA